jgi:thioredoxin 1
MAKTLEELVNSSKTPVFIDFWAEWCGPCRTIAPVVLQLAREFAGRLTVVKVNVDRQPGAASRFQVQGIPALLLFDKGELKWRTAGVVTYQQLRQEVLKVLGS